MKKILFPGSFNPFTVGHADILRRLLTISDKVVVGIGINGDKTRSSKDELENMEAIRTFIDKEGMADRVEVITYSGLTGETAKEIGADCMARGVRNGTDFDYEYSLACANRDAFGIETVLIPADPALSFVSSSLIRDLRVGGRKDLATKYIDPIQ